MPQPRDDHRQANPPAYPDDQSARKHELLLPPHVLDYVRRKRSAKRLMRIISGVLIVLALAILLFMLLHKSDSQRAYAAAEDFIIIVQANDAAKAYDMGSPAFRSATTEEKLRQMFDQVEPFLSGARIERVDSYYAVGERGAPRAIVVYSAAKGQKVTYIRLVMDEQGGVWKAHSILTKSEPLHAQPE